MPCYLYANLNTKRAHSLAGSTYNADSISRSVMIFLRSLNVSKHLLTVQWTAILLRLKPRGITLNNQYTMLKLFLFFTPYKV